MIYPYCGSRTILQDGNYVYGEDSQRYKLYVFSKYLECDVYVGYFMMELQRKVHRQTVNSEINVFVSYAKQVRQNCLLFIFSFSSTIKPEIYQAHPHEKKNAIETQCFHSILSGYPVLIIVFSASVIPFLS